MPRTVEFEDVARLAEAAGEGYRIAVATDADGTLWEGDIGDAMFLEVATSDAMGPKARESFLARGGAMLGDAAPQGVPQLAQALMDRYAAGEIDVAVMCELQAESMGDRSDAAFAELVARVVARHLPLVRPEVRALLIEARARGYGIHVVSGSVGRAVEALLVLAEVPFDTVQGATLVIDRGHVLPSLAGPIPLHEGKVEALRSVGAWPPRVGLGDGHWDAPFLRGAAVPVLVFARPGLRAAMAGHPRLMLLE